MSGDGGLFAFLEPPRARRSDPDTSHEAAASMQDARGRQALEILRALAHNSAGLNHSQIDWTCGWPACTASRRLHELRKAGLIEKTDERRPTESGRPAYVYQLTEAGWEVVRRGEG